MTVAPMDPELSSGFVLSVRALGTFDCWFEEVSLVQSFVVVKSKEASELLRAERALKLAILFGDVSSFVSR